MRTSASSVAFSKMAGGNSILIFGTHCILLISLVPYCHGNVGSANHLLLFDSLPDGFSHQKRTPFDVRTNYTGSIQMVESRDFRVVVNISAPTLQQTYDVEAGLYAHGGRVILEIKEHKSTASIINLLWLFLGIAGATILVGIITAYHTIKWYNQEKQKFDISDHKSFASSSQRGGVYRSGNIMQMVPLGSGGGDHILRGDDPDNMRNLRCDEELRQVQEMPEEEEAEAREMEQLNKLKFQADTDLSAENEDSDPQERNLIKSRFHSHAKTVHKDLIKKSSSGKKAVSYKRTQNGMYEGVPTDQDEASNDEVDSPEKEGKVANNADKKAIFEIPNLQVKMDGSGTKDGGVMEKMMNVSSKDEPAYANDPSETDPLVLVLADVHKTSPGKTEVVSISKEKPGNIYVSASELTPVVMSTFGAGMTTSTPKSATNSSAPKSTANSSASKSTANSSAPKSATNSSAETPESTTADDIFQNVAKKYNMEGPWFTQEFTSMGDIPEDPREDDQSIISGSAVSTSMYGSSEIFQNNDAMNTYYNVDSDLDVPPIDLDDFLSDGGLPSPMGFPMYKSAERGKANDDIRLIPGALKSPAATMGRMVNPIKPRPYSSIIFRGPPLGDSSDITSSETNQDTGDSPPLPSPPAERANQQPETVFEFPPPPKFYKPPQHIVRREQQKLDQQDGGAGGEYVQVKQPERESPNPGNKGRGGVRASPLNPTYMNLTILSTLCVLTLVSGVYSNMGGRDETRVDITVFAPSHFFTNTTRVFFNFNKDTELISSKDSTVLVYDVSRPIIDKNLVSVSPCFNASCEQGCDETNGECICFKGYKLSHTGECLDVNECMEGKAKCDRAAGCYNRKGTYDCICGEDYYGNGKSCRECKLKCPEHYYEVQPCAQEIQKICKACTQSCRTGYYMAQPCSNHENAICRVCRPECVPGEFESRQCTNFHDRECRNMTHLLVPSSSSNIILEEKQHIREDSAKLDKLPAHYVGFTRYKLFRGSGIHLELTVRFIDATQQFLPVNASQPYRLDLVAPAVLKSYSVQRYCPTPIPDYYILRYKKLEGVTFKQHDNGSLGACDIHKTEELRPTTSGSNQYFLCSQPGSLTSIFSIDEDFFLARTKWVDRSKRCQRNSQLCELCTRKCGTDYIFSVDPTCSVAGLGDGDNNIDESPRLMMCYNCCVKRNCSADCKDYHKRRCQPEQCSKGNLLEFTLEPSWDSSQDGRFFCHITPAPRQHLLELDYSVHAEASESPLHISKVMIYGDKMWEEKGVMTYSDGILDVVANSSLGTMPNFLEGWTNIKSGVFKVGTYKSHGSEFGTSAIRPDFVFIRPPEPHGVPPMPGAHQECTHTTLNRMLLASNMENPYIHDWKLEGIANGSVPLIVTNKAQDPVVTATLSRDVPILKKLFVPVRLDKRNFSSDLTQNSTHWVITIQGEVTRCPGYLHIALLDPNYQSGLLFDCDVAVLCPTTFSVTFAVPSTDKLGLNKDVVVVVADEVGEHNFRIYRKASIKADVAEGMDFEIDVRPVASDNPTPFAVREEKEKKDEDKGEMKEIPELPLEIPYLLMISGSILLLIVLAILGLCFQPGLPMPDTPYAKWYHPVFATGYMMFQFTYSTIVSGTVFFLILTVITSEHVNFVVNHGQSGVVSTASSHIELLQLQRHLEGEISRQDLLAGAAQKVCMQDVKKIAVDMKKLHQLLLNSTEDIFERHRLDLLLSQQKLHVRDKLSKDLENFRAAYAKAARSVLRQVNQNALASFQNVQYNNTWLEGVRFLHAAVMLQMEAKHKERKSFMDWTGIKADLAKLEIDLTFSLPALPRLDDIPALPPDPPPVKRNSPQQQPENKPIRSIQVHNNWFFPLEESGTNGAVMFQSANTEEDGQNGKSRSGVFFVFLIMFLLCDIVLLSHRMCKAWTVAKLILFGFPEYFREQKENEGGAGGGGAGDDDVFQSKESKSRLAPVTGCRDSPMCQNIKMFFTQTISTTFFPKIVGAVAVCVFLSCLLDFSNRYLTVSELEKAGLYQSTDQYLDLQTSMTNARLQTHADHINTVDFPAFQASMSSYITRHRTVLTMYRRHLTGLQNLTMEMYCEHLKAIGIQGNCSQSSHRLKDQSSLAWDAIASVTHTCKFQPVDPKLFTRVTDSKSGFTERQVETLLGSLRYIVYYTSQLTVIYLAVIVLKELAGAVLWILIQRSGVIRLRIIVEHDQDDTVH